MNHKVVARRRIFKGLIIPNYKQYTVFLRVLKFPSTARNTCMLGILFFMFIHASTIISLSKTENKNFVEDDSEWPPIDLRMEAKKNRDPGL